MQLLFARIVVVASLIGLGGCEKKIGSTPISEIHKLEYVQACRTSYIAKHNMGYINLNDADPIDVCTCIFLWHVSWDYPTLSAEDWGKGSRNDAFGRCVEGQIPSEQGWRDGLAKRQAAYDAAVKAK